MTTVIDAEPADIAGSVCFVSIVVSTVESKLQNGVLQFALKKGGYGDEEEMGG